MSQTWPPVRHVPLAPFRRAAPLDAEAVAGAVTTVAAKVVAQAQEYGRSDTYLSPFAKRAAAHDPASTAIGGKLDDSTAILAVVQSGRP